MAFFAKLYTDIIGDEKLMRAARNGARHLQLLPWLIAFAKKADDHGRLTVGGEPAEPIDIARGIPSATAKSVEKCMAELHSIGVLTIEEGKFFKFSSWDRRSGDGKPSDQPVAVAERVKRHRERRAALKAQREVGSPTPTPSIDGPSNALHVTPDNATEEEEEEEIEEEQQQPGALHAVAVAVAVDAVADFGIRLTQAANLGITKRWGEQPTPLNYGQSTQLAHDLVEMGVSLETATRAIGKVCAAKRGPKPGGVEYFRLAIIAEHQADQQRTFERSNPVVESVSSAGEQAVRTAVHQVVTAQDREAENEIRRRYDAERQRAAKLWSADPANELRYAAMVSAATADHAAILDTRFGQTARDKAVILACGDAAEFPDFETWLAARVKSG